MQWKRKKYMITLQNPTDNIGLIPLKQLIPTKLLYSIQKKEKQ